MVMTGKHLARRKSFREDFKSAFLTGVAALLPTILTLLIIVKALEFVDYHIGRPIRSGILFIVYHGLGRERIADLVPGGSQVPADQLYGKFYEAYAPQWYLAILSFLVAITLVYFVGFIVASVAGRGAYRLVERGLVRLPGVRSVYPYVKQVTDMLFSSRTIKDFNRVVAVEYPRRGIYSIGLVTGAGLRDVEAATGEDYLNVFIPSSPTPLTGYTILVRSQEIIDLPLSVEQAFKFVISGGVIIPPGQVGRETVLTVEPGKAPRGQPRTLAALRSDETAGESAAVPPAGRSPTAGEGTE